MPGSSNPTGLNALTPKVTGDNGGEFGGLLQPIHQVAFRSIGATYVQAEVTALRDALIAAGIMRAS